MYATVWCAFKEKNCASPEPFPSGWKTNYDDIVYDNIPGHIVKDVPWREQSNRQKNLIQPDASGAFKLGLLYVRDCHCFSWKH